MTFKFDVPFPQASTMQLLNVVTAAAELTANHFFNGGKAITMRLGNYFRDPERGGAEYWVSGLIADDAVIMQVYADQCPAGTQDMRLVDLFNPLWPMHNAEGKPSTVMEVLGPHMKDIPGVTQGNFVPIEISSLSAYYKITKHVASIFGAMLVRGGNRPEYFIEEARKEVDGIQNPPLPRLELAICLQKGQDVQRQIEVERKTVADREVPQPVLDEFNRPIWDPVKDANGKPVMEHAKDSRTGRPVVGPNGEFVMQVKLEKRIQMVTTPYETIERSMATVVDTPIFLQITKVPEIDYTDTDTVIKNESSYDPTWMLANVLRGDCKKMAPFHKMDEGQ